MALSLILCLGFLFLPLAKTNQTIMPLMKSIEKMVDFYQGDYQNLNIDGLFGLRVLEGHFQLLLDKYESHKLNHLETEIVARIKAMKSKATRTADLAIQYVKKDDFQYYKQLSFVVGGPWTMFVDERHQVDPTKIWSQDLYHAKEKVVMNEKVSDNCMAELIGSHRKNGTRCDISMDCVKTMTYPGLLGYGITHQILWTMLGEKAGCKKEMEVKILQNKRGTLADFRQEMCTNNFYQMKETLSKMQNIVIPSFQDLFLEQLFICPSLGFYEFLHLDFLPQIFSWQLKQGCFGKMERVKSTVKLDKALKGVFAYDYYDDDNDEFTNMMEAMQQKNTVKDGVLVYNKTNKIKVGLTKESYDVPSNQGRKLLVEKEMTGGCLAHKTAVASGALVMYLRFLCESDSPLTLDKSRIARSTNKTFVETRLIDPNSLNAAKLNIDVHDLKVELDANEVEDPDDAKQNKKQTPKVSYLKPNNMIQNVGLNKANVDNNNNSVKGSKVVNAGPDVKNDMSDLNHHLNQLNAPDLNEGNLNPNIIKQNVVDQNLVYGREDGMVNVNEKFMVNEAGNNYNNLIGGAVQGIDEGDKDDNDGAVDDDDMDKNGDGEGDPDGQDGVDDDDDDDDDDDGEYADDDNDEDEDEEDIDDGYYDNNQDKVGDKNKDNDDDYYDERDVKAKDFPKVGDNIGIEQPIGRNHLNDYNENNYDNNKNNEEEDEDNDDNDDEYDAGYDDNDRNNVDGVDAVHPHINLRNIGRHNYRFNDDKNVNMMNDYKYKNDDNDDEEEDDDAGDEYEYDDENDEMAQRRKEELKGDVQFEETVKNVNVKRQSAIQTDLLPGGETLSPTTAFFVFAFCISLVLILMYKFIRKRRIRIRFNPKYFNV